MATKKSDAAKRLTLADLHKKSKKRREVEVTIDGEKYSWVLQAVSPSVMDQLQADNPPNKEQKARGASFDINKFAPALIAACSAEPEITAEDMQEIIESGNWSTGEVNFLFDACTELCMSGFDTNFTVSD